MTRADSGHDDQPRSNADAQRSAESHAVQRQVRVVILGDAARFEFKGVIDSLAARSCPVEFLSVPELCSRRFHSVNSGTSRLDLVIWLQSYAGQYSVADHNATRDVLGSIPMVCVYGAWAEGEHRTGKPLSGMPRFAWHQWPARIETVWRDILAGCAPSTMNPSGTLAIASNSVTSRALLSAAVQSLGWRTLELRDPSIHAEAEVLVWDDACDPRTAPLTVETAVALCPGRPVIAILGFPRVQDQQRLVEFGVNHLLAKPFELSDLESLIRVVMGSSTACELSGQPSQGPISP